MRVEGRYDDGVTHTVDRQGTGSPPKNPMVPDCQYRCVLSWPLPPCAKRAAQGAAREAKSPRYDYGTQLIPGPRRRPERGFWKLHS